MKEILLIILLIISGIAAYIYDRRGQKEFDDFCEQQEKKNEENHLYI